MTRMPPFYCRNSSGVRSAVGGERVKQSGGDGIVPLP
jgi:hypothetical protein